MPDELAVQVVQRSRGRPTRTTRGRARGSRCRVRASSARALVLRDLPQARPRARARAVRGARAHPRGLREAPGAAVLERAQDPARDDHLVHLVRAVVDAAPRAIRYITASGVSSVIPSPPCTCRARSITSFSTRAAKNLISDTSTRASSPSSSRCAACSVISRHAWISAADSAIQFWIVCFSASRSPNAFSLERVRAHHVERPLHLAEPAHHVVDAARAEPLLRDPEAVARLAEHVRRPARGRR